MASQLQQFADRFKSNKSTTPFGGYGNNSSKTTPFNIFKNNFKRTSPSNLTGQNQTPLPPNMTNFRTGKDVYASPTPVPSSPGNTGTTTPKLSPAGQEYAQNSLGAYKGVEINSGSSVEDQIRRINNPQPDITPPTRTGNNQDGRQSYIDSLKAEQFPTSYKAEMDARNKAAERLAKVQSEREKMEVDARREYEKTLDAPGGTVAAAQQGATLARRRSNTELADVALQESAALRAAQVSQGILESAQGQDRQLTLDEIQALNDSGANLPFGSTISQAMANGAITTTGGGTSGTDISGMAQMVANGTMDIANVPSELRGQVSTAVGEMGGINKPTSPYLKNIAENGLNAIGGLLEIAERNPGIFGKTAALPLPDWLRTDDYRDYEGQLEFIKGNIIPATLTAMREASTTGGALGQVSDREGAWLASSLGALSMKQKPSSVIKQLRLIETRLNQWQGAVANPESITANYTLADGTKLGDIHPEYFDGSQGGGSIWDSGENWD